MNPRPDSDQIMVALRNVQDPELRQDVVTLGMVREARCDADGVAHVEITLTTPGCPLKSSFRTQVDDTVGRLRGVERVELTFGAMDQAQREALRTRLSDGRQQRSPGISLPSDCRVIAVTSGKGGVGKSTVTVNLALSLRQLGYEVGVVDADVYGYSIPTMMGIDQRPVTVDRMIVPPVAHEVRTMSIGFFLGQEEAVVWRGPMLHRALEQFLGDVHWGDLDFLVVDMPPGTGDIAISLGQLLPRAEALVVTTPQHAAQTVARRSALSAMKLDQVVLGVVETMGDPVDGPAVFGRGGGERLAAELSVPLLGELPLDPVVREAGDSGVPIVAQAASGEHAPDGPVARAAACFLDLARAVVDRRPLQVGPDPVPPTPADRIKKPLALL